MMAAEYVSSPVEQPADHTRRRPLVVAVETRVVDVGVEALDAHVRHASANPPQEGDRLVLAKVEAVLRVQHVEQPAERRPIAFR
jgi:hypothetical protein